MLRTFEAKTLSLIPTDKSNVLRSSASLLCSNCLWPSGVREEVSEATGRWIKLRQRPLFNPLRLKGGRCIGNRLMHSFDPV